MTEPKKPDPFSLPPQKQKTTYDPLAETLNTSESKFSQENFSQMETMDIPPEQPLGGASQMETIDIPPEPFKNNTAQMETMDIPPEQPLGGASQMETIDISPDSSESNTSQMNTMAEAWEQEVSESPISHMATADIPPEEFGQGSQEHTDTVMHRVQTSSPKGRSGATTAIQPGASAFDAPDPQVGDLIADYQVVKKLGEGGMGAVYKCFDPILKRQVALKLLKGKFSQNKKFRARFEIEAQAVAQLRHPNIIQVFRAGEDPVRKCLFFAMDFIEGQSLEDIINRKKRLMPEEALRYVEQVAEGLKYSHQKNILHRDIKPANVMVSPDNQAMIADFGLAKMVGDVEDLNALSDAPSTPAAAHLTQQGAIVGTPYYLSPERIAGINDDKRSDIYALGMVLYHCLTGNPPFIRETVYEILAAQKEEEPPAIEKFAPECPAVVVKIFKKATEKNPETRFQNMDELLESIRDIRRAKERKREIEEKKKLSQDMVIALSSMKLEKKPKSRMPRHLGPVLAILALITIFAVIFQYSHSPASSSSNHTEKKVLETRAIDQEWTEGKETRLVGKLRKVEELLDDKIGLVIDLNVLEEEDATDERELFFSKEVWESLKKGATQKLEPEEYVAFQGKAIVTDVEYPYLEGYATSYLPIRPLKKYYMKENQTVLLEKGFTSTIAGEYVQANGTILYILELENELEILLGDNENSQVWVNVTLKTVKNIESRHFSPRVGDEVYAIGRLEIEEFNGQPLYKIWVEEDKGDFFTMKREERK